MRSTGVKRQQPADSGSSSKSKAAKIAPRPTRVVGRAVQRLLALQRQNVRDRKGLTAGLPKTKAKLISAARTLLGCSEPLLTFVPLTKGVYADVGAAVETGRGRDAAATAAPTPATTATATPAAAATTGADSRTTGADSRAAPAPVMVRTPKVFAKTPNLGRMMHALEEAQQATARLQAMQQKAELVEARATDPEAKAMLKPCLAWVQSQLLGNEGEGRQEHGAEWLAHLPTHFPPGLGIRERRC